MRSRKKRIAVFLVAAFIMQLVYPCGNTERAKVKATNSNPFYEDELHNYKMLPYSVDLSGENTVATGGAIEIKKDNFFKNTEAAFQYYESIKFTYEVIFKDESEKDDKLKTTGLSEDAWNFDTVECAFAFESEDGRRLKCHSKNKWINKSSLEVLINHDGGLQPLENWNVYFSLTLHNAQDGAWPLGVESVQIKTIEFIPYENICYTECTPTPNSTANSSYDFNTPQPPKLNSIENNKNRAGKDFSIDLSQYQVKFTGRLCWIDLQDELDDAWYKAEDYSEIKVRYKIDCKELDENYKEYREYPNYLCEGLRISSIHDCDRLDGFSNEEKNFLVYRPTAKIKREGEVTFIPYVKDDNVLKKIIGFNIVPFGQADWPKELESITITGIDFIAKKNTVTPTVTVTPTIKPTTTVTPTIKPTTGTTQIKSTNIPSSTPGISVPQKVTNLKLKAGKKKQIKISWNNQKQADGYEIYRSTKKNKGYQKIADGFKNNCSFTDSKVKYAKNYYYKVRAYCISGKNYQYGVFSDVKKLMLKRKAPAFKLKRKITTDGIHYISIRLKSCSDPYLQMWVRFGKKKYKKIPLSKHKIKKNTALNFKYTPGKGKISFRIRSYRVQNKKRVYSKSKTKRI